MSQTFIENLTYAIKNKTLQEIHQFQDFVSPISIKERTRILQTKTPRISAVLIVIYKFNDRLCFSLIQRSVYKGTHSGQISFPGGKREETDVDLSHTALRECEEEIGLKISKKQLIGTLEEMYVPPSNFMISPFIAFIDEPPVFRLDNREVAELIHFPINELKTDNIKSKQILLPNGGSLQANCYLLNEKIIWGATATILCELHWLLSLKNPTEKLAIQQMLNSHT